MHTERANFISVYRIYHAQRNDNTTTSFILYLEMHVYNSDLQMKESRSDTFL